MVLKTGSPDAYGARACLVDLPQAKLTWLDGGHFVLDEYFREVASEIKAHFGHEAWGIDCALCSKARYRGPLSILSSA